MNYRFELSREWIADHQPAYFVMLNPSTADANHDDPTIRRCVGFATRWGCSGIRVANLYGWRATNPRDLWAAPDPVGEMNDWHLARHIGQAGDAGVVVAWGAHARPDRVARFVELLGRVPAWCLGTTKDGHPRHPLMLPYSAALTPWTYHA